MASAVAISPPYHLLAAACELRAHALSCSRVGHRANLGVQVLRLHVLSDPLVSEEVCKRVAIVTFYIS